jgi:fructokinase
LVDLANWKATLNGMEGARRLIGGIEAGGTKFMCAVGDSAGQILEQTRIETRDPITTLSDVHRYFEAAQTRCGSISALGVGAFGPLDLRPASPTYGFITSTPKPGWANTNLAGVLARGLEVPVRLDTDVNAAAFGELRWGAGRNLDSLVYVTVGTGIGVGAVHRGRAVHGLMHMEMGHVMIRRHASDVSFAGTCPFHGDCLEGMASGPAILSRTGSEFSAASPLDPIWAIEADYLGQLCALLVFSHSPERILIGGGVMQAGLYPRIQERMLHWLNGYVTATEIQKAGYVTAPGLAGLAGIKGALSLAMQSTS